MCILKRIQSDCAYIILPSNLCYIVSEKHNAFPLRIDNSRQSVIHAMLHFSAIPLTVAYSSDHIFNVMIDCVSQKILI